jgi:hypothetical protein
MAAQRRLLTITDLRRGINQIDPPIASGPADQFLEDGRNIEFHAGGVCKKRQGSDEPTGLTYSATAGKLAALFRHVLGTSEQLTELWCVTDGGGLGRMPIADLEFASVAPGDALTTSVVQHANAVSLNGKLFVAARSTEDRLHVWDGTSYRRVGLDTTAAAPTFVEAAGAVTDSRKYRVTYIKKTGSTIDLRSEPSAETAVVTLTGEQVTITKNASPGESETHWELWVASVASNYGTFIKIGEAAIASTTIVDNNTDIEDTAYDGLVAESLGENTLFPSAKFLCTDENRLIAAGSWEDSNLASRVWFSAVLGASDIGDEERTPNSIGAGQRFYVDVGRGIDGGITGIAGPLADAIYVFKNSSIWKLIKTGVASNPYRVVNVHRNIGAINHKSIVLGEDQAGQPALYFLSRRGAYRIATAGLEYLGADVETEWRDVHLDAAQAVAHGVHHHLKHQVWWWVATGASDVPDSLMVYDTMRGVSTEAGGRGGWMIYDGLITNGYCSVMYSKELGTSLASYDMRPFFGLTTTNNQLIMADVDDVYTDYDGAGYTSWFRTRAYALGGVDKRANVDGVSVIAKPEVDASPCLWVRAEQNWRTSWAEYHISVPPSDKSRVLVYQPEPTSVKQGPAQNDLVSLYVYDSPLQMVGWQVDALVVDYRLEGER